MDACAAMSGEMECASEADSAECIEFIGVIENLCFQGCGRFVGAGTKSVSANACGDMDAKCFIANIFAREDIHCHLATEESVVSEAVVGSFLRACDIMKDCGNREDILVSSFGFG